MQRKKRNAGQVQPAFSHRGTRTCNLQNLRKVLTRGEFPSLYRDRFHVRTTKDCSGAAAPFLYISFYDIIERWSEIHPLMKKLTLSDYQALAEFRFQIRKFLRFSEQAVKQAGLEHGQYQLLLAIKGMPAGVRPRIRELAER